jgi:hypothetical protein
VTSLASVAMAGGGITAMVAKHWRCLAGMVGTTVVVTARLPTRLVHFALEQEVASPLVSYSL